MPAFLAAIFLSAFLLFQVQPILARYILPWFGGSPAVWTACMLCFQVGLLAGYAYAHLLVVKFRDQIRWQVGIHLALVVLAFVLLPITPDESLKPKDATNPVLGIVRLLAYSVGLPYLVLSASGPLLQHWFSRAAPGASPYRLYAISNLGSLLGLVTYPFVFEPKLALGQQTSLWSWAFVGYGLLAAACAWLLVKGIKAYREDESTRNQEATQTASKSPISDVLLWILLPACASILLLATTNQMTQDIAVVPLLWVVPLGMYLVTFIISFDHERWYVRKLWIPLAAILIGLMIHLLGGDNLDDDELHIAWQIAIYVSAMFACCLVCHGEMVRRKPDPRQLTAFYLAISFGGALGGAFVSLAAPHLFDGFWELHFGLGFFALLLVATLKHDVSSLPKPQRTGLGLAWLAGVIAMGIFLGKHISAYRDGAIVSKRNFYGIMRVFEGGESETDDYYKVLYHGRIDHGSQYLSDKHRRWAGSYYSDNSGPDAYFQHHPARRQGTGIHFGVIGLGVGTLSAFAEQGDKVRFYEINPQVEELARQEFLYLEDCLGEESVVLGDARVVLERELARGENQQFDALFLDAFSGDAIPIHLLTREAFELYFQHLKPDGILAVHITNRHLDLDSPVRILADDLGKRAILIEHEPVDDYTRYSAWVLIGAEDNELLNTLDAYGYISDWWLEKPKPIRWTDDYSNLLQVISWE